MYFRRTLYCEELNKILDEEEELIKEWKRDFSKQTSTEKTYGEGFGPISTKTIENEKLRYIWNHLSVLHKESRKIEEIKKLVEKEEGHLPRKKRKALKQLRKKLDWKLIKFSKIMESFGKEDAFQTRKYFIANLKHFNFRRYRKLLKELVYDEITFWKHLVEEQKILSSNINNVIEHYNSLKKEYKKVIDEINSNNPNWWRSYQILVFGKVDKEIPPYIAEDMGNAKTKRIYRGHLVSMIDYCTKALQLLKRAEKLSKDIDMRLKKTRPN